MRLLSLRYVRPLRTTKGLDRSSLEAEGSVEVRVGADPVVWPLVDETDSVRPKERFTCLVLEEGLTTSCSAYMTTCFRSKAVNPRVFSGRWRCLALDPRRSLGALDAIECTEPAELLRGGRTARPRPPKALVLALERVETEARGSATTGRGLGRCGCSRDVVFSPTIPVAGRSGCGDTVSWDERLAWLPLDDLVCRNGLCERDDGAGPADVELVEAELERWRCLACFRLGVRG